MNPLNFCRQLQKDLNIKGLEEYQKFILENEGFVSPDDELKGIYNTTLHLPFKKVALEFFSKDNKNTNVKNILLVEEQEEKLEIAAWFFHPGTGWYNLPAAYLQRKDWGFKEGKRLRINWKFDQRLQTQQESLFFIFITPVLSLLNMLACCNVKTERIKSKIPQKRGALPYDTYHVLVLSNNNSSHNEGTNTHRSPREHVRRGHIRITNSGLRVWVNAHIVNKGIGAKVEKDYTFAA